MNEYSFHEYANLFPLLRDEELTALSKDIEVNGQLEPIIVEGKIILDGRNRYLACRKAGIEPTFIEWHSKGEILPFIVSKNLHRRHLRTNQKALIAVQIIDIFKDEAKKRQLNGTLASSDARGKASAHAGKALGISTRTVERTKRVLEFGSDKLIETVEKSDINLVDAYEISKLPIEEQDTKLSYNPLNKKGTNHFANDRESNQSWLTPKPLLEQYIYKFFDSGIDLDPTSNCSLNPNVKASKHYTIQMDGLSKPWKGTVFCNPPYDSILPFTNKTLSEFESGTLKEILFLLPINSGTVWFNTMVDNGFIFCFLKVRLHFENKNGAAPVRSPFGNILVYKGNRTKRFKSVFSSTGHILQDC